MTSQHSASGQVSIVFLLILVVAAFSFTACSNDSKKQNGETNKTVNTTESPQQDAATTNNKPEGNNTTETTPTDASTANATAITAKRGHKIIKDNGCLACHSTDGKQLAGPTFKNLYDRKIASENGKTITADAAYLAESIKDPKAIIVKGFSPVMPRYSYLKDDQIASIIAYIKTISKSE